MNISSSTPARTADESALTRYAYRSDTETSTEPRVSDPVIPILFLPKALLRL
jgi:hypothetical protein